MFNIKSDVRTRALAEVSAWVKWQGLLPDPAFAERLLEEALGYAQQRREAGWPPNVGASAIMLMMARLPLERIGLSRETIDKIV